jgi:hypothetical protein
LGTRDSHWSENVFGSEIMTGYVGPGSNMPISRVTVGSLADIGYSVNYAAADVYAPSATSVLAANTAGTTAAARASLVASAHADLRFLSSAESGMTPASPAGTANLAERQAPLTDSSPPTRRAQEVAIDSILCDSMLDWRRLAHATRLA